MFVHFCFFLDFFFFNDTATTEIYTLSLHDALPISRRSETAARSTRLLWQKTGTCSIFRQARSPRSEMRFTYAEAMTDARFYAPLARAAEAAGYTSMTVADSLIYPEQSDSTYPYTDTGDREFLADKEFVETMILVTHLAAATSTLRFTPFVLKLPVRPPVLVAKQVSSVAWLSNNRLGLGVGLSPWPEDFIAMGVPWERRGKRMDECIDIIRGLNTGEFFSYDGEFYQLPAMKQTPAPTEKVPLL